MTTLQGTAAESSSRPVFHDTSEECIICLCPFEESIRTITLGCGHRYHFACIRDQLEHAQPNPAKRLLFTGCRCAKCDVFCDHPDLKHLTRTTDALRSKVDELLKEQVGNDNPVSMRDARRTMAFYLCSFCKDPYFGGTIECADTEEGELPPDDRLCPKCSPKVQMQCENPELHRSFHVWKCRYCCSVANHVCYGTVHFCDSCHDRNTARERGGGRLQPIACPGRNVCQHPMPSDDATCHANGPSADCEQVYYCAWCESSRNRNEQPMEDGSVNLVLNPSGAQGARHWRALERPVFAVEQSEIPVNQTTTTNFVSSFQWSVMSQVVDLRSYLHNPSTATIQVSAKYMARTDCPSVFVLQGRLLDINGRVLYRESTTELQAPPDGWERARLELPPTRNAAYAELLIAGKDCRMWRGLFGSKVADCSIRVLGTPEELATQMREGSIANNRRPANRVAPRGWAAPPAAVGRRRLPRNQQQQQQQAQQQWIVDAWVVPLVIFLVWFLNYNDY